VFTRARVQLTLAYAAILGITIGVLGGSAYAVARHQLDDEINRSITDSLTELRGAGLPATAPSLAGDSNGDGHDDDDEHRDDDHDDDGSVPGVAADVFFVTTDASGTVLSNPRRVDLEGIAFVDLVAAAQTGDGRQDVRGEHGHYRISTVAITGGDGQYLHVGRSLEARDRQLRTLALVFAAGGSFALVLSTAGGYWLAGRTLGPIRAAMDAQRRFVSDASHELRTPITVVKANNELLLRHPEQRIEANMDQVEAIAVETDHMARLVGDLLTLARADEGAAELSREPLDLCELASEVVRDMEPVAEARGLVLEWQGDRAMVDGDPQRLRQLAAILVDNALTYTPAGGRVRVTCHSSGRHVDFSVTDTGPGVAAADQDRIFDRFFRVDTSRSRAEGGTGLGLSIGRWIAEAHGGRLSVRSREGEGATFTFRMAGRG